jgi:hypothetical protein
LSSAIHGVSIVVAINKKRRYYWHPGLRLESVFPASSKVNYNTAELEVTKNRYSFYAQPLNSSRL